MRFGTTPGWRALDPDVAADLVPEPAEPAIDPARPRTTVVRRSAPGDPVERAPVGERGTPTPTTAAPDPPTGLVGRLTTSHWWWRIGIVLVLVALVLLKFG